MALGNDVTLKVGFDIDKFQAELRKTNGMLSSWSSTAKSLLAGSIAGFTIVDVGKQMIDVTAQFQKFSAVLGNTLGSDSQAQKALKEIRQFAIETPFEVAEVTAAYVRWANQGLSPTIDRMRKLGDIASSLGAGFEQTAEAFKDLMVGQTKRIEEIGIAAEAVRNTNLIRLSFKGVTIEIEKNAEGVQKALDIYSQLNGVLGTSDAVAKTLGGQISALSDAWKNLLLTMGNESGGLMGSFITDATNFLNIISHADISAMDKFKMIFGSWDGAGDELKKVNEELSKLNKLHTDRVIRMADEAIKDFGFDLEKIARIYANPIFTEDVLAEVSRRHTEKLNAEKKAAEAAAKAYNELFHSKAKTVSAIPQGTTALQNATIPQPDSLPGKVGSPFGDLIPQDILDANATKIDQYNALAQDIMTINEQIRVSWMSLAEESLIAMATAFGSGEPIGKAFLKSLAQFGIKFGAMLIKLGIANIAIGNKPKGVQQIAAGVALVAAGAALAASTANSGGAGGRGGASDSGGASRSTVNANTQSEQRLVIQVVAKGNDLVGVYDSAKSSQVIRRGG